MDYTGEVGIILINLSNEPFTIKSGERIAQMVISTYNVVQWDDVESLTKTERGDGGFGHNHQHLSNHLNSLKNVSIQLLQLLLIQY